MILHKPSDKTSSDPIDFWYLPEPSDTDPLKPNIQKIEKSSGQDTKKRPMQRHLDRDESTGTIEYNEFLVIDLLLINPNHLILNYKFFINLFSRSNLHTSHPSKEGI